MPDPWEEYSPTDTEAAPWQEFEPVAVAEPEAPVTQPSSFFQKFAPPGPLQVVSAYQALRGIKPREISTPGEAAELAYEQAMTPGVTGTAPYIEKGLKYSLAPPALAFRLLPKQTEEDVRKAVAEGVSEYGIEPLTSPFGLLTAGLGTIPGTAGRLAGVGFAALGASGLGESASQLLEAIKARNIAESIRAGMGVGAQGLMVGAGGRMALRRAPKLRAAPAPEPVVPEPTITEPIPETRPERLLRKPAIEMPAPERPPQNLTELELFLERERIREAKTVPEPVKRPAQEPPPIIGEEPKAVEWELITPEKYAFEDEMRRIGEREKVSAEFEGTYPPTAEQLGTFQSREFVPELSELTGHAPEIEKLPAKLKPPSTPLVTSEQIRASKKGIIAGSVMEQWANRVYGKGDLGTLATPQGIAAWAVREAAFLEREAMSFVDWSAKMIKEHGPEIKSHLKPIWDQAQNYISTYRARKEKYNAIYGKSETVLRPVRPQPGEGEGKVPVSRPIEEAAVRGEPVEAKAGEIPDTTGRRVLGDVTGTTIPVKVPEGFKDLPPVKPGYKRLYHGEGGPSAAGKGGQWYHDDPQYVAGFGPDMYYVDVPIEVANAARQKVLERGKATGGIAGAKGYLFEGDIADWTKKSKKIEGTAEPKVEVLDESVIPEPKPGIISGSPLELWANNVLREGRLASFGSPKTIAAIAIKEAAFLEREARTFASWSARLIKEYGPDIKPHLQEIWDRSQNYYERSLAARPKPAITAEQIEQNAKVRGNQAARGEKPPGDNPPVTTDGSETPSENVTRPNKDYQIFNRLNTAQWNFSFGRLGEAARSAINRIFLGEFRMRESTRRDIKTYVADLLKSIPRKMRWRGGEAFFDVLDGKTMDQIRAEWTGKEGGEKVIAAAERIKNRLEEIRVTIRDTKRDAFRGYLNSMDKPFLEDLYRRNISPQLGGPAMTKGQLADALTAHEFPDNWGIADGSYLPHMFFGNWKATVTLPGGAQSGVVIRGKTLAQTKAEIYRLTKDNPAFQNASIKIEQDIVVPADMIRLGDRQFWKHVQKMKDAMGATSSEIREAQAGIIGRRAAKQKWWGALRARVGYKGYSRNFQQVMSSYLSGFHRWKELSEMQREVMPLIEQVRREGRRNAADRLDGIMENLWGKPAKSTVEFDAFIRRIPGLRDWIKPLALDRWSRNVRSIISYAALMTVRFGVINRLQPLQGLYPIVGERLLAKGKILQHTAEGQRLLDEAGVKFDPGQYAPERGIVTRASEFMQRVRGEQSNQELAFLSMYLHGTEKGLSKPEAINYAKLRGQLMTQFTPLISDIPQVLEGPFGQLMFQFKRFPIKQTELAANMIRDKNVAGIARMLAVFAVLGGASFYLRQTFRDKKTQLAVKKNFAEQVGDKGADLLMYGLPGYIGADISGSLVLGDEPYGADIYSKIGRQFTGPFVSMGIETAKGITTEARKPIPPLEKTMAIMRRIPTLKPIAELQSLISGDLDILTPDGETKYHRVIGDAIAGLGSFKSAHEANKQLALNGLMELEKESKQLKNAYVASGGSDEARQKILDFNERWPEVAITGRELMGYIRYRQREAGKTKEEKVARKKFRPLLED